MGGLTEAIKKQNTKAIPKELPYGKNVKYE